jgi:hypothetical protein
MWQDYKELCRMYWEFTINHGWKLLIIVLIIWLIFGIIYFIKKQ